MVSNLITQYNNKWGISIPRISQKTLKKSKQNKITTTPTPPKKTTRFELGLLLQGWWR
jgi:hypothetical protein